MCIVVFILICIFLVTNDVKHFFHKLIDNSYISLVKYLFKSLLFCLFWLLVLLSSKSPLHVLNTSPLTYVYVFKYFLPICGLPLYFLKCILQKAKVFYLSKVHLLFFLFMAYVFCVLRNTGLNHGYKYFFLHFLIDVL